MKYNIQCVGRPNIQVEGTLAASATGSYHTLEIIHTTENTFVAVLRLDYGGSACQIAVTTTLKDKMQEWLTTLLQDPRPKIVMDAYYNAQRMNLNTDSVIGDLFAQVESVISQLTEVEV